MSVVNEDKVIGVIAAMLEAEKNKLSANSVSSDFEAWDSLRHLQICMALEETFSVKISIDDIPKLDSVKNIINYLSEQQS